MPQEPVVSVVVASHGRPLRLRWLLNALSEQTLAEPWEVVVVHDYDQATTERIMGAHQLAADGRMRQIAIEPGTGSPARQRNVGWRAAAGDLVAFTDDDCRPEADWLERLVNAAGERPGAVLQGATFPDPLEREILRAPHVRTLRVEPVNAYRQTANIAYPRGLLARLEGFDERAVAGEDVGLSLRARRLGVEIAPVSDAVVYHAIESHTLPGIVIQNVKWRYLAYLVKQHPEFREDLTWGVFWDEEHMRVTAAVAGLAIAATGRPAALVLAAPYVRRGLRRRGRTLRQRAVGAAELPGAMTRQFAEVLGMAFGSVRYRTFLL